MLPASVRAVVCRSSNCGKTNMSVKKFAVWFENVYVYSKLLQQSKYWYLVNLFQHWPKKSIITFSNNSDVIPPSEALPNSIFIFIFDDVALRQAGRDKKILCNGTTRGCRLLLFLSDVRKNIEAPYMWQYKCVDSVQTEWYQSETRVQWSRIPIYPIRISAIYVINVGSKSMNF